jgi:hypothetical protein
MSRYEIEEFLQLIRHLTVDVKARHQIVTRLSLLESC